MFLYSRIVPLTLLPVRAEIPRYSGILTLKMALSFGIIGSIAAISLIFINNAGT